MGRQQYESEHDLMNERNAIAAFLELLETRWGVDYLEFKLTKEMIIDFLVIGQHEPKRFAVVEVKRRRHKFGDYPDLMISTIKWNAGIAYHNLGFKFFILIEYNDGLYWYCYQPIHSDVSKAFHVAIKEGGRTIQKRDKWDEEECAHIPIAYWKPIKEQEVEPR
jgi:hypothetical protein